MKENLLHSLPETDRARGFSIGTPYDVFGKVAGTYEYFVKLDPFDALQESNELNNLVGARFTILPDGTVDLPGCGTLAALASDPDKDRWTGQSLSSGGLAKVYGFDDVDGSRPDCWRYLAEVQEAGKAADATGYR